MLNKPKELFLSRLYFKALWRRFPYNESQWGPKQHCVWWGENVVAIKSKLTILIFLQNVVVFMIYVTFYKKYMIHDLKNPIPELESII